MIGRENGAELVFHERNCLDFCMFRLGFDKPQIYSVVQHILFDEAGIIYHSLYPERRKGFLIIFDQSGKDMGADGNAGADADGTQGIPVLDFFFHIFKKRNNVQGIQKAVCRSILPVLLQPGLQKAGPGEALRQLL